MRSRAEPSTSRSRVLMGMNSSSAVVRETLPYRPYSPVTAVRTGAERLSERSTSAESLLAEVVSLCQ